MVSMEELLNNNAFLMLATFFIPITTTFIVAIIVYNVRNFLKKKINDYYSYRKDFDAAVIERLSRVYKEVDLDANVQSELDNLRYDYQRDIINFIEYDTGIEYMKSEPVLEVDFIDEDDVYAFDDRKIIYFSGITNNMNFESQEIVNDFSKSFGAAEVGILFESRFLDQRLHLTTRRIYNGQKLEGFEYIYDSTELCEKYDIYNIEELSEKIVNQYNGKDFKHSPYFEKLVLSEPDKKELDYLYNETKLDFSIVLENGIGRLRIFLNKEKCEEIINDDLSSQYCDNVIRIINSVLRILK